MTYIDPTSPSLDNLPEQYQSDQSDIAIEQSAIHGSGDAGVGLVTGAAGRA